MPEESLWATFFDPDCVLHALECHRDCGDIVEFGCGYGTFTIPAAQMVRDQVLAWDIEPEMVAETSRKAKEAGLSNVIACVRDFVADGTGLEDEQVGYAMVFNLLHLDQPVTFLREAFRVLKAEGKLALIHWRSDIETPRGPSLAIRPTAEQCREWAEQAGFVFAREVALPGAPYHWGLLLRKSL